MGQPSALWLVPLSGERKAQPLIRGPHPLYEAAFSPDGRWPAYESTESGRAEIYVTHFPSLKGKAQISNGGRQIIWRSDSKALYYTTPSDYLVEAPLVERDADLEVGVLRRLFKFKNAQFNTYSAHSFAVSRDGRRFIITEQEAEFSSLNLMVNWLQALKK
jgi:Tol biopolymer transport system component